MENFKQAVVASDKQTVDIGPGLRWIDVYKAVEKDGLSVSGGRVCQQILTHPMLFSLTMEQDGPCRGAWTHPWRRHIPLREEAWLGV
jgi:hypothetical protein